MSQFRVVRGTYKWDGYKVDNSISYYLEIIWEGDDVSLFNWENYRMSRRRSPWTKRPFESYSNFGNIDTIILLWTEKNVNGRWEPYKLTGYHLGFAKKVSEGASTL